MTCLSSSLASHTGSALPCPIRMLIRSTMLISPTYCAYALRQPRAACVARLLEHPLQ